jgi:hypothetical protein
MFRKVRIAFAFRDYALKVVLTRKADPRDGNHRRTEHDESLTRPVRHFTETEAMVFVCPI